MTDTPEKIWAWVQNWVGPMHGKPYWGAFKRGFKRAPKIEIVKSIFNPFNRLFWLPERRVPVQHVTEYRRADLPPTPTQIMADRTEDVWVLVEALKNARHELKEYEAKLRGETYNSPEINAALATLEKQND